MAVVGVADQYMIMMAVTLLFTVLALTYRKNVVLGLLASISWLIAGLAHMSVGDQTSHLTAALPWLYWAFGMIFAVNVTLSVFGGRREKRWSMELG